MPNCFCLTSKLTNRITPFAQIDEELCAHLGVEVHPTKYAFGWYNCIGLALAMGKTFEQQRVLFKEDPELLRIIDFLDQHYTPDAWSTVGGGSGPSDK